MVGRARLRPETEGRGGAPAPMADGGDRGGGGRRGRNREELFFFPMPFASAVGDKIFCIAVVATVRSAKQHIPLSFCISLLSRHPITKWAQRSDRVFLTIELPDAKDVKLNLKPEGHFNFSAKGSDDSPYALDLELFDAVNVEECKAAVAPRTICYLVKKAESKWWPRLLKKEGRPPVFLKVDWDKWQDEDDEDIGFNEFGDMDFSKLDMGGADDDDIEDDEDDVVESANNDEGAKAEESKGEGAAPAALAAEEAKP